MNTSLKELSPPLERARTDGLLRSTDVFAATFVVFLKKTLHGEFKLARWQMNLQFCDRFSGIADRLSLISASSECPFPRGPQDELFTNSFSQRSVLTR